jgi:hypothetical protein
MNALLCGNQQAGRCPPSRQYVWWYYPPDQTRHFPFPAGRCIICFAILLGAEEWTLFRTGRLTVDRELDALHRVRDHDIPFKHKEAQPP